MDNDIKRIALTIIMPCYNTEKYLNKTMASIFSQSFNDYEIIMVDDGSTDSTPKLLDDLAEKHPVQRRISNYQGENCEETDSCDYRLWRNWL